MTYDVILGRASGDDKRRFCTYECYFLTQRAVKPQNQMSTSEG